MEFFQRSVVLVQFSIARYITYFKTIFRICVVQPKNCEECGSSAYDVHMVLTEIRSIREWADVIADMNSRETAFQEWVIESMRAGIEAENYLCRQMSLQNGLLRMDLGSCYGYLDHPLPRVEPDSATDNAAEENAGGEDQ
ncbi:hypothetical protein GCK32_015518 [Trichostrongylus colubriformis]|uniref:Uncharacterized protein n=1 Tax=Trichostrongylus colubriformis TaxID=6319 RepID=A0AAN8FLG9_TRICO